MNLNRVLGPEDVARLAADAVGRAVTARRDARIVLPTGVTPLPLYAELVRRCRDSRLDLSATSIGLRAATTC